MRSLAISLLVLFISPLCVYAQGGPPLLTDDPGTPGPGKWEINVAFTTEKHHEETRFETPLLDMNYGIGERHQLKFEIPWVVLDERGEETKNGLGNSLAGWKWRFMDEKECGISTSIYPQIEFNNPGSSSADRGLADKGWQFLLPIQAAKTFGKFGLNLEFGYIIKEKLEDEWLYGLAASYELSEKFELIGEVFGTGQRDFNQHELVFNVGTRYKFTEKRILLFAIGRGLENTGVSEAQLLSYLGIQFLF